MITEALLATAPAPIPLTVGGHTFRMVPVRGGIFLEKLNLLLPGWNFRLPTEAEWEYAARGGNAAPSDRVTGSHPVTWGYSGSDRLESVAWWDGNSNGETKPVGLKVPNALGLFDMSGNVWEWCEDWFDGDFYKECAENGTVLNPRNDGVGSWRVFRGGGWFYYDPQVCRVANRSENYPESRYNDTGFRLAASPPGSVAGL